MVANEKEHWEPREQYVNCELDELEEMASVCGEEGEKGLRYLFTALEEPRSAGPFTLYCGKAGSYCATCLDSRASCAVQPLLGHTSDTICRSWVTSLCHVIIEGGEQACSIKGVRPREVN